MKKSKMLAASVLLCAVLILCAVSASAAGDENGSSMPPGTFVGVMNASNYVELRKIDEEMLAKEGLRRSTPDETFAVPLDVLLSGSYMPVDGDVIIVTGPDGEEYELTVDVVELKPVDPPKLPRWSQSVTGQNVPKNINGNQGVQIGQSTYQASSDDTYPAFATSNWSSNLSSVNVSVTDITAGIVYWGTVYQTGTYIFFDISLTSGHYYYYMTSGQMNNTSTSGTSDFTIFSTQFVYESQS